MEFDIGQKLKFNNGYLYFLLFFLFLFVSIINHHIHQIQIIRHNFGAGDFYQVIMKMMLHL